MHLKVSERIFVRHFLVIIFMLEKFSEHNFITQEVSHESRLLNLQQICSSLLGFSLSTSEKCNFSVSASTSCSGCCTPQKKFLVQLLGYIARSHAQI